MSIRKLHAAWFAIAALTGCAADHPSPAPIPAPGRVVVDPGGHGFALHPSTEDECRLAGTIPDAMMAAWLKAFRNLAGR